MAPRRLVALAVVFVVVGAPAATMACQLTCEAHEMAATAASPSEHHACHGSASPASGPTVAATAHICGHPGELPIGTEYATQPLIVPALTATACAVAAQDDGRPVHRAIDIEQSPPLLVALSSYLRI